MQEQKVSKSSSRATRFGVWNIIWSGIFSIMLLAAAITWLWPYHNLPTATGRQAHSTLPWENESLRVEAVTGHWESAEGNERMMLRAAFYPAAEIELGESQGSGMLYISFLDEAGHQAGDTINLYYKNGQFNPRKELNIDAEGNKARVFVEAGYEKATDFELHQHDESSPLWRVSLRYRPDGSAEVKPAGYVTIPAKLLP